VLSKKESVGRLLLGADNDKKFINILKDLENTSLGRSYS
jgi:hypothetical protein